MNRRGRAINSNNLSKDREALKGLARIALAGFSLMAIGWFGAVVFEHLDYHKTGDWIVTYSILLKFIPFKEIWATAIHPSSWRYYIVPVGAMFAVFLGAAFYVKDIYALPRLRHALQYVISSMSASDYASLMIDGGEKKVVKGKINLIDAIGGPGLVTIQPGNVVMFRKLRAPSNITLGESYFLEPFETIGQIANLDDQDDARGGVNALTRDGIKITIDDLHFRYRIFPEIRNGRPIRRSLDDPYPFDERALWNMAYNLVVEESGQESWRKAVGRIITGGITDYINFHRVDHLTAPREHAQDPRQELRNRLFYGPPRWGLRSYGAELLWVDVGHFSIDDKQVDDIRTERWSVDLLGEADVEIEKGKTWRQMLKDRGHAEGQAELIASISDSLRQVDLTGDPAGNMRRILLLRTAQIMDNLNESNRKLESGS